MGKGFRKRLFSMTFFGPFSWWPKNALLLQGIVKHGATVYKSCNTDSFSKR